MICRVKVFKTKRWHRWLDTALASPEDIVPWSRAAPVSGSRYPVQARSVVGLITWL
jgi:isoamylase